MFIYSIKSSSSIKKIIFFTLIAVLIGCFKEKIGEELEEKNDKKIKSKIFDLYKENTKVDEISNEMEINLKDLTREEQMKLFKKGIDPKKVIQVMKLAKVGDLDSILSLAHLFYSMGDVERSKDVLEIGVKEKYVEAIYNLAVIYKKENNIIKYNELLDMLPEGYVVREKVEKIDSKVISIYNKGIDYLKEKKYEDAINLFQEAYSLGIKDLDIKIAYLYKEINDLEKSVEWFEKSAKRGNKDGKYMTGLTYFQMEEYLKSIPYLEKSYKEGKKKISILIGLAYEKIMDNVNAMKWYKIAEKNGDPEASKIIADLENIQKRKLNSIDSIFGNVILEYDILDRTLESILNPKIEVPFDDRPNTEGNKKILGIKESKAVKKKNYNVRMDEILNKEVYLIK